MPLSPGRDERPNSPAYQHYVHRAYLAGFTAPDNPPGHEPALFIYREFRGEPKRRAPKNIGGENYFYNYEGDDGRWYSDIEKNLGRIETPGLAALKKLTEVSDRSALSVDEQEALATYVALAQIRVPRFKESFQAFGERLATTGFAAVRHLLPPELRDPPLEPPPELAEALRTGTAKIEATPIMWLETMSNVLPEVAERAYVMHWSVLRAPRPATVITGDVPVVLTAPYVTPGAMRAGWGHARVEATFPIDRDHVLLLTWKRNRPRIAVNQYVIDEVNLRTACYSHHEIYSPRVLDPATLLVPKRQPQWPRLPLRGTPRPVRSRRHGF